MIHNHFTFIDLFAGIGGFRKAFDSIGGKCVFTSEWDKACRTTYQANYGCDHRVVGDIRDVVIGICGGRYLEGRTVACQTVLPRDRAARGPADLGDIACCICHDRCTGG
ncbi:MAG: DNA cytosine methyltransferase [Leptothrix sp. (in: b-proteobacteria)]